MSAQTMIVFTTCGDADAARTLAQSLVTAGLAACVNIIPGVESVYRWRGDIERDREVLLVIKTNAAKFEKLTAAIETQSSYELPEVLAVPIAAGSEKYLAWLDRSLALEQVPESGQN